MFVMKKVLISLIRFYQRRISPYKKPCCRFYPTCSAYAIEAIEKKGVLRGGLMSVWRILRCNPFCKGGFDPVEKED
jgi:putative membrane protein insertion efficiency factor